MTDNDMYVPGHGNFIAHGGNRGETFAPWRAFNKELGSSGNFWIDHVPHYSSTAPYESISTAPKTILYDGSVLLGGWIDLICPYPIKLSSVSIAPRTNYWQISLQKGVILGSNNDEDWYQIDTINYNSPSGSTGTAAISNELTNFSLVSTSYYSHIRLVCTHLTSQYGNAPNYDMHWQLGELVYFGTPGPTTLDKGSLSLTRSLDVPLITNGLGETPRKENLWMYLDTETNSRLGDTVSKIRRDRMVADVSGRGNHVLCVGSVHYNEVHKAIHFDGSPGGQPEVAFSPNLRFTGDQNFTTSLWFWSDKTQASMAALEHALYCTGNDGGGQYGRSGLSWYNNIGLVVWNSGRGSAQFGNATFKEKMWNHVVVTYPGGGLDGVRVWLNGVEQTRTNSGGTDAFAFDLRDMMCFGDWLNSSGLFQEQYPWNGYISNFKLWNTALSEQDVLLDYNRGRLRKTTTVLTETMLGINTTPKTDLDIRGSARVTGILAIQGGQLLIAGQAGSGGIDAGENRYQTITGQLAGTVFKRTAGGVADSPVFAIITHPNDYAFFSGRVTGSVRASATGNADSFDYTFEFYRNVNSSVSGFWSSGIKTNGYISSIGNSTSAWTGGGSASDGNLAFIMTFNFNTNGDLVAGSQCAYKIDYVASHPGFGIQGMGEW
jgi:hypothetical protein